MTYHCSLFNRTNCRLAPTTQAAQQSQGIQTLLEAEKEAAKIVQKARTCKSLLPVRSKATPWYQYLQVAWRGDSQQRQCNDQAAAQTSEDD